MPPEKKDAVAGLQRVDGCSALLYPAHCSISRTVGILGKGNLRVVQRGMRALIKGEFGSRADQRALRAHQDVANGDAWARLRLQLNLSRASEDNTAGIHGCV